MVTITYDALNDLVHELGEALSKTTGIPVDDLNLFVLNDTVTGYLDRYGVEYADAVNHAVAVDGTAALVSLLSHDRDLLVRDGGGGLISQGEYDALRGLLAELRGSS